MGAEQIFKIPLKIAEAVGGYNAGRLAVEAFEEAVAKAPKIVAADATALERLSAEHWQRYRSGIGFEVGLAAASDGSPVVRASTANQFMGAVRFDLKARAWHPLTQLDGLPARTIEPVRRMQGSTWYNVQGNDFKVSFFAFSNKGPILTINDPGGIELGRARLDLSPRTWHLQSN